MARIEESIFIKRPVDKVFAYALIDLKNMLKLHSNVIEVEQTPSGQMSVGTTYQWFVRIMGRKMKASAKVTEYELNKRIGIDEYFGSSIAKTTFSVEPVEGGTKFTQRNESKFSGFVKVFSPLSVFFTRRQVKEGLNNLKSILEAQTQNP